MATNNSTNDGTRTTHGITIAEGTSTPNYLVLTAGQLPIGTTSSDPAGATLTAGTNVTITNGSGSISIAQSAGGAGALTWIASVTASNSATVDFANNLSSTYDNYFVVIENVVPVTTSVTFELLVGTGSGPSYQTSSYLGTISSYDSGGGNFNSASLTTAVSLTNSNTSMVNTSTWGAGGHILVSNCNNSSNNKTVTSHISYPRSSSLLCVGLGAIQWQAATVLTSLRFLMSSGNVSTGTFKLYGLQN